MTFLVVAFARSGKSLLRHRPFGSVEPLLYGKRAVEPQGAMGEENRKLSSAFAGIAADSLGDVRRGIHWYTLLLGVVIRVLGGLASRCGVARNLDSPSIQPDAARTEGIFDHQFAAIILLRLR